jgi:hypothetical protein
LIFLVFNKLPKEKLLPATGCKNNSFSGVKALAIFEK